MSDDTIRRLQAARGTVYLLRQFPDHGEQVCRVAMRDVTPGLCPGQFISEFPTMGELGQLCAVFGV